MPTLKQTRFTAWTLTPEEERLGSLLPDLVYKRIQTQQAAAAEDFLNIKLNDEVHKLRAAELQGQITFAQFLLDCHEAELINLQTLGKGETQ